MINVGSFIHTFMFLWMSYIYLYLCGFLWQYETLPNEAQTQPITTEDASPSEDTTSQISDVETDLFIGLPESRIRRLGNA